MKWLIPNLKYVLVPSKMPAICPYSNLHNKIYDFWEINWSQTFSKSGAPAKYWRDNFLRQDIACALFHENEVIACVLCTFYNLESHASFKSEYFDYLPKTAIDFLKQRGFKKVMTMEYLFVQENWRKAHFGFSIPEIAMGLGFKISIACDCDAVLGTPIKKTHIDEIAEHYGGTEIGKINKYGYTLEALVVPVQDLKSNPDIKIASAIDRMWEERIDYARIIDAHKRSLGRRQNVKDHKIIRRHHG